MHVSTAQGEVVEKTETTWLSRIVIKNFKNFRNFSSLDVATYNIVYNTMHVKTMSNSPVQQAGVQSAQSQLVTYNAQDPSDLGRLVILQLATNRLTATR
jgi:hypothetical protein